MPQWRIEAKTKHPRHFVPMLVSDAVRVAGGWVGEVTPFGDFQLVVHFEVGPEQRAALEEEFERTGIRIYSNDWDPPEVAGAVSGAITVTLLAPEHPLFGSLGRQPGPM